MLNGPADTPTPPAPGSSWSDLSRPPLRQGPLRRALTDGEDAVWRALDVVASTGSTNADVAARAAAGEAEGYVLLADHQVSGRGRLARQWTAPPRAALAVSVLLRPAVADRPDRQGWSWLPLLAGLAVADALTVTCGLPARLKWPNDVLVPDGGDVRAGVLRKVCGVLAESTADGAVIVGAGINVTQRESELPVPTATSLLVAGAATTDRDTVARAYLRALATRYRAWTAAAGDPVAAGLAAAYREACSTIGQDVQVMLPRGQVLTGRAEGVDDDGRLLVRRADDRLETLAAGDVVHVRPPSQD